MSKTALVNGAFDILTAGHVRLLNAAAEYGLVMVAVNTDESIAAYKGLGRPIFTLDERMAILLALRSVEFVVSFGTEDDLRAIVRTHRPTFMVKGSEYRGRLITGAEELRAHGGEMIFVDHGWPLPASSSEIVRRCRALPETSVDPNRSLNEEGRY